MIAVLALAVGVLFATGTWMVMQRTLTRVILGIALVSHGVNLLLIYAGGPPGTPPFIGLDEGVLSDSLSQAMILTAIVIAFGLTGFLLALAYRSWLLTGHDEVEDDVEDRRIARHALEAPPEETPGGYDDRLPSDFPEDGGEGAGGST